MKFVVYVSLACFFLGCSNSKDWNGADTGDASSWGIYTDDGVKNELVAELCLFDNKENYKNIVFMNSDLGEKYRIFWDFKGGYEKIVAYNPWASSGPQEIHIESRFLRNQPGYRYILIENLTRNYDFGEFLNIDITTDIKIIKEGSCTEN